MLVAQCSSDTEDGRCEVPCRRVKEVEDSAGTLSLSSPEGREGWGEQAAPSTQWQWGRSGGCSGPNFYRRVTASSGPGLSLQELNVAITAGSAYIAACSTIPRANPDVVPNPNAEFRSSKEI
jgi:hypothetical protein